MNSAPETMTRPILRRLLEFMNGMPVNQNIEEWIIAFREALRQLLGRGNVHRIVISVNTNYGNPCNPVRRNW